MVYDNKVRSTSSVTLAMPVVFFLSGLLGGIDATVLPLPTDTHLNVSLKSGTGGEIYSFVRNDISEEYAKDSFGTFVLNLLNQTKDMDPEFARAVSDNFWDVYERF
jgi:hypothetical protein